MNNVSYETRKSGRSRTWLLLGLLLVVALVLVWVTGLHAAPMIAAAGILVFGITANTLAYETPVTGATPPTAFQSSRHNEVTAVVTGDGSSTDFTITHNFGLTAAELADGWPRVSFEYLLAAGYTAAALITSKTANTVVFSCSAFTGAGLRVRIERPHTIVR
jgi:hypothetical protein